MMKMYFEKWFFKIFCASLLFAQIVSAQTLNFTWMKGPNTHNHAGVYGIMGVPAAANTPGSRCLYASWKDASGNFWLFGGQGHFSSNLIGDFNDLWKYNPTTNTWTWINGNNTVNNAGVYGTMGVSAPTNKPGARIDAACWTDAFGNFWLYGGIGYATNNTTQVALGDLWKYNVSANEWVWVNGTNAAAPPSVYGTQGVLSPTNYPGYRSRSGYWADANGDFWLFGGDGYATNSPQGGTYLNDLWKYSVATNEWVWMKGSTLYNQFGTYGTQGVATANTNPGVRRNMVCWTDNMGNLWLFGGDGASSNSFNGFFLNDLWKYSIANNQWTWMKGSNLLQQTGTYGTINIAAPANNPGARYGGFGWCHPTTGDLYLFGGQGYAASSSAILNDLWRYSPSTNQWVWLKGSNVGNQTSVYGTQGVTSTSNMSASRIYFRGWLDAANNMWFFGGLALVGLPLVEYYSDLWKIDNCTPPNVSIISSKNTICRGETATLTANGATTYSWSTGQTGNTTTVSPQITTAFNVSSTNSVGCTQQQSFLQQVFVPPFISTSISEPQICAGHSVVLSATGASSYTWSNGQTGTVAIFTPTLPTSAFMPTVQYTDGNNCVNTKSFTLTVLSSPTITIVSSNTLICAGETITLTANGANSYSWQSNVFANTKTVTVAPANTDTYTVIGSGNNNCTSQTSFTQLVDACVSISNKLDKTLAIKIYPNPNSGSFFIEHSAAIIFKLFNSIGQLIKEERFDTTNKHPVELNFAKGIYYYSVMDENSIETKGKLLIE